MRLYAVSDLHLSNRAARDALLALPPHPDDWLILAGDIGEKEAHLHYALTVLTPRFKRMIWTPGNHDLWTLPSDRSALRGEAKYRRLVQVCRDYGVLTPEDPYVAWPPERPTHILAPLFLLYDYSFRPDHVAADEAIGWAAESGIMSVDEDLLHPDPYPSRSVWCTLRVRYTEKRLAAIDAPLPLVLINHFPLRQDHARLRRAPRLSVWCGTRRTDDWHTRFPVAVVVYGHLHIRRGHSDDGVRFEEVSLGYPGQWDHRVGLTPYLRRIL